MNGLSESCRNICRRHGIEMYFKGANTVRELLVHPKDKDNILKKSGVIYIFKCGRVECEDEYIGESGRTFAERFKEHMKSPSPIHDHFTTTAHNVSLDNFSIVAGKTRAWTETSKKICWSESMTHPSIGILANISCHIYGMRCWSSHQN